MANKKPLENLFNRVRRSVKPTETVGAPGVATYGGFVQSNEINPASRDERYRLYSNILVNTSIVAAGARYFLNLVGKADWSFTPSEADTDGKFAKLTEEMLTKDPVTPWHRIVRRAAMYRFYGFSVQEWTAKRRDDGLITLADVAPRSQLSIERWDLNSDGSVNGMLQTSPQTQEEIFIPRTKTLYVVDDSLSDSPEGLGIFRHITAAAKRLTRYEQLEGFGFETDLRGIPIGRGPFKELAADVKEGKITEAQRVSAEAPLKNFVKGHIRSAALGLYLDSSVYETKDEAGRPSVTPKWGVDLLKGGSNSFEQNAKAIERLNREIARILGVEQLLLGADSAGSFALSRDKTNSFFLLVDGALVEIREAVIMDLINVLWMLNGWPDEMKPEVGTEAVRFIDAAEVAATLRDMATSGAVLDPRDPVIDEVRNIMGVSPQLEFDERDLSVLEVKDPNKDKKDPNKEEIPAKE